MIVLLEFMDSYWVKKVLTFSLFDQNAYKQVLLSKTLVKALHRHNLGKNQHRYPIVLLSFEKLTGIQKFYYHQPTRHIISSRFFNLLYNLICQAKNHEVAFLFPQLQNHIQFISIKLLRRLEYQQNDHCLRFYKVLLMEDSLLQKMIC